MITWVADNLDFLSFPMNAIGVSYQISIKGYIAPNTQLLNTALLALLEANNSSRNKKKLYLSGLWWEANKRLHKLSLLGNK